MPTHRKEIEKYTVLQHQFSNTKKHCK